MNRYILYILGSFFVFFLCGVVFIPIINRFCKKRKLYDLPGVRKIHKTGIPRLGGISFLPSMIAAFFLAMSVFGQHLANFMEDESAVYCVRALSPSVLCVCVMAAFRGYYQGHSNMVPTAVI